MEQNQWPQIGYNLQDQLASPLSNLSRCYFPYQDYNSSKEDEEISLTRLVKADWPEIGGVQLANASFDY